MKSAGISGLGTVHSGISRHALISVGSSSLPRVVATLRVD